MSEKDFDKGYKSGFKFGKSEGVNMADIELVIKIPKNTYRQIQALARNGYFEHDICGNSMRRIANGTPLTPDMLADMLMEERIRGELKHDISYSKDIIDDVRCKLTVDIIDRRPCFCGAELREVWRESEEVND